MNVNAIPTAHVLTTAAWIKKLAYLIALIGTIASYGTQVALLLAYEVGNFSYVIPGTVDLLAICAALALQLSGLDRTSRRIAGFVLTVAVGVSVAANLTGGHNTVARLAHAWPVVAYLLGELLANRVRSFAARLVAAEAARTAAAAPVVPAPVAPAQVVPVAAPVTPAPATPAAPVLPVPVAPPAVPAPVVQAQQVVRQTTASMPIPVSPAPAGRRERVMVSPLTGRVLMEAPPKA